MKVSIRQALKNVSSEKYDKQNIFLFFGILFIAGVLGLFLPEELANQAVLRTMPPEQVLALYSDPKVIIIFLLSMFLCFISNGIYIVASNNAIHNRNGVFPNPLNEIGKIISASFKFFTGSSIVIFLIFMLSLIISLILLNINPMLWLVIVPLVVILVHAWLCVTFRFYMTLRFKDFFSFKRSWVMIGKNLRRFGSYVWKSILCIFLVVLLNFIIIFILGMIFGAMGVLSGNMQETETAVRAISLIVQVILGGFLSVYFVDLNAQLLGPIVMKKKKKPIVQKESQI